MGQGDRRREDLISHESHLWSASMYNKTTAITIRESHDEDEIETTNESMFWCSPLRVGFVPALRLRQQLERRSFADTRKMLVAVVEKFRLTSLPIWCEDGYDGIVSLAAGV